MSLDINEKPQWSLLDSEEDGSLEIQVFDSVISEFNDITGFPIDYYVLELGSTTDKIYGEDPQVKFSTPYRTKIIYDPTEENNILDVFGFSSDDTVQYAQISKSIFARDVSKTILPKIGDLVHTLWNNSKYEIVDIGAEQKIFQAHKMSWEFIMKPYRYGYENKENENIFLSVPDDMPEMNDIFDNTLTGKIPSDNKTIDKISDTLSDDIDTAFYGYND